MAKIKEQRGIINFVFWFLLFSFLVKQSRVELAKRGTRLKEFQEIVNNFLEHCKNQKVVYFISIVLLISSFFNSSKTKLNIIELYSSRAARPTDKCVYL